MITNELCYANAYAWFSNSRLSVILGEYWYMKPARENNVNTAVSGKYTTFRTCFQRAGIFNLSNVGSRKYTALQIMSLLTSVATPKALKRQTLGKYKNHTYVVRTFRQ